MHVRGAAAEVRFEPVDVRCVAVRAPAALGHADQHLVGLLVVLMSPVIGRAGAGVGVVGQHLQAVGVVYISELGRQVLQ